MQVPEPPAIEFQFRNSGQAKQVRGRQEVHGVVERYLAGNSACVSQGKSLSLSIRIRDNGLSTLETSILRPLKQEGGRRQEKRVDSMCCVGNMVSGPSLFSASFSPFLSDVTGTCCGFSQNFKSTW